MSTQNSTAPSSAQSNTNKVIDYYPSWFDWNRSSLQAYQKGGSKQRVDVINISFALPKSNGTLMWTDVDKSEGGNYKKTKDIIQALKAEGKRVTIAVGGASGAEWNLESPAAIKTLAENIKKFVDEYGLDGVDIDYEDLDRNKRKNVPDLIFELRKLMPQDKYLITYAAWSIGAYGDANPGHEHPEWRGGNEGIEIDILKKAGHLLDWVNVMSYDAFAPGLNFNPIEAIEAYRSLLGSASKVVLGIELGPHGWPSSVKTTSEQVKPWIQYAAQKGFGGVMFWTLDYDAGPQKRTGELDGTFLKLTTQIMPKAYVTDVKNMKDKVTESSAKFDVKSSMETGGPGGDKKGTADARPLEMEKAKEGAKPEKLTPDASTVAAAPVHHQYRPLGDKEGDKKKGVDKKELPSKADRKDSKEQDEITRLGISDLTPEYQKQVLAIHKTQIENIARKKAQYDAEIYQHKQIIDSTPEVQRDGVRNQYRVRGEQINEDLKATEKAFSDQLNHVIGQLRGEQKRTRPGGPA